LAPAGSDLVLLAFLGLFTLSAGPRRSKFGSPSKRVTLFQATQEGLMRAHPLASQQGLTGIVGRSPATVHLRAEIDRIAAYSSNVLITGPSGTGKELVARQIHERSRRAPQPFIPVDCAAMSGELMSSQLFGHVAGAFTGANCDALGCFRAANRGTIFLDEIGELEFSLQAKLLRVLQDHVVTPVGSHQGQRVDVRVVAATNRNLRADVLARRFREDLFYRLEVVHLRTTALCERPEDIHDLAALFLAQLTAEGLPECSLSSEASAALVEFCWPGNVRQLRNVLEQAVIDCTGAVISDLLLRRIISLSFAAEGAEVESALQDVCIGATSAIASQKKAASQQSTEQALPMSGESLPWQTLEQLERQHIERTLARTFYNRSAAARMLGVTRQSLLRKIKRYGLDRKESGLK
jgi:DNA-binding NtrC family response regulator